MKKFLIGSVIFISILFNNSVEAQTKKPLPQKKPVAAVSTAAAKASIERGKLLYGANCLACHQADGSGVPNLNPPLIKTSWVLGPKPKLIEILLKGSNGQVEIDGDTFHNTMPSQAHLTDVQIADVLTFVRSSFGNKASSVTATDVKAVRAKIK